ncbi:MAG TPA: hypothetical protein V6D00_14955 [Pantanalinema sp.]
MTRHSPSKSFAIAALVLALTACTVPGPVVSRGPGFDLMGPQREVSAGIRVSLRSAGRGVQTLPTAWATASFVLSNPATLVSDRYQDLARASFDVAGGSADSSAALFPNTRPGTGYALHASTYVDSADGPLRNALGYQAGLELRANDATQAHIQLATIFPWTSHVLANAGGSEADDTVPSDRGDGGLPGDAKFKRPMGIAFAPDGTLYVADAGASRIRTITPARDRVDSLIYVPGAGLRALAFAPGLDSGADVLFFTDTDNDRVCMVRNLGTTNDVTALPDLGAEPSGMCYDPVRKQLYVSLNNDTLSFISVANLALPVATTVSVTTGSVGLSNPQGLALSADGSLLYVADTGRHRILALDVATKQATVLAGTGSEGDLAKASEGDGGLASGATFKRPVDLAYDAFDGGHLYVMDTGAKVVRVVTLRNKLIATAWGDGGALDVVTSRAAQLTSLLDPAGMGLMVDASSASLYVSDRARIRSTTTP